MILDHKDLTFISDIRSTIAGKCVELKDGAKLRPSCTKYAMIQNRLHTLDNIEFCIDSSLALVNCEQAGLTNNRLRWDITSLGQLRSSDGRCLSLVGNDVLMTPCEEDPSPDLIAQQWRTDPWMWASTSQV